MTVSELKEIVQRGLEEVKRTFLDFKTEIKKDFSDFKTNDFFHLSQRVDKLALKVYIGIGIIMTLEFIILAKILS